MTEHQCHHEGEFARLEERTNNFSLRFDEINDKLDVLVQKIDLSASKSAMIANDLVAEKLENKWKHRITAIIAGGASGGGVVGIIKALGLFIK